jgi:hypothetical protein
LSEHTREWLWISHQQNHAENKEKDEYKERKIKEERKPRQNEMK